MESTYRIAEVAERSGFSPPTLRYYEEIGLLPAPARTSSGYRLYDARTLDRLRFIARAKQLGCTLEEIADLTEAWNAGTCGPVQERLHDVVAVKLAQTNDQIAELTAFASELRSTQAAMSAHTPDGACDDDCGCVTPMGATIPTQVAALLPTIELRSASEPIACSMQSDAIPERVQQWRSLLSTVTSRVALPDGVRLEFPVTVDVAEISSLVAAESSCCSFFTFSITIDPSGVVLDVRAPQDAQELVNALLGDV